MPDLFVGSSAGRKSCVRCPPASALSNKTKTFGLLPHGEAASASGDPPCSKIYAPLWSSPMPGPSPGHATGDWRRSWYPSLGFQTFGQPKKLLGLFTASLHKEAVSG